MKANKNCPFNCGCQVDGRVSTVDSVHLTRIFSEEGVRQLVFDIEVNSAPSPDGFDAYSFMKLVGEQSRRIRWIW